MALNIKDPATERLAAEVARLTGETKTGAVRTALQERRDRLRVRADRQARAERLRRFLVDEAWPQVPADVRDTLMSKSDREAILGYGPDGA